MDFILRYQWEIFILAEVLSLIFILLFGVTRYVANKRKLSLGFLFLFIVLLFLEGCISTVRL